MICSDWFESHFPTSIHHPLVRHGSSCEKNKVCAIGSVWIFSQVMFSSQSTTQVPSRYDDPFLRYETYDKKIKIRSAVSESFWKPLAHYCQQPKTHFTRASARIHMICAESLFCWVGVGVGRTEVLTDKLRCSRRRLRRYKASNCKSWLVICITALQPMWRSAPLGKPLLEGLVSSFRFLLIQLILFRTPWSDVNWEGEREYRMRSPFGNSPSHPRRVDAQRAVYGWGTQCPVLVPTL